MSDTIDEHLSEPAVEYAEEQIGRDVQIAAVVVPPVPREKVSDYADGDLESHLYDITDLAYAVNHAGDPMLDGSVGDEDPYGVADETVAEVKVARGALMASFNREIERCADRLGVDTDETDDYVGAIRDALDYEVDTSVDENWEELDELDEPDDPE